MNPAVPTLAAPPAAQPWPVLQAPPHWRHIDFISDLHLQAGESATFEAWQNFMQTTSADAVFILGDLFEVWIGDDVLTQTPAEPGLSPGFEARCAAILKAASQRLSLFFMHGNRDFLLGPVFAQACGMTLLRDPTVLAYADQRWLLSHGDALCLADTDYLQFRTQVRSPAWQQDFLAKPLAERQAIARALRTQSEERKSSGAAYADVDDRLACDWLNAAQASTLIHGHTHQPADHDLGLDPAQTMHRLVLSDWDGAASPARLEILRLSTSAARPASGCLHQRLPADLAANSISISRGD
jgi:UDP-2,3-diacylglucosamine hydrolase